MLTLGGAALVERFVRWPVLRWPAWGLAALCLAGFVYEFETGDYEEFFSRGLRAGTDCL